MDPEGPWDDEDSDEGWFCGSPACQLLRVKEGRPAAVSNDTNPITAVRLATWNSNVLGACDFLVPNQYVCITRRGGSWVGPSDSEIPDDGEGPVRGGPGSTPSLPILDNPTWPLANVQDGIAPDCNRYVLANSTIASCWKIANDNGISQARLFELNFILGEPGERCDTQMWLGYYYWVRTTGEGPTTTAPPATTSVPASEPTAVAAPLPIHDGTTPNCNKWAEAQDGDYCWKMATPASSSAPSTSGTRCWPTAIDSCDMIWPGYFYCIGVKSDPPTTTTQAPPASTPATAPKPSQTQAGIPASCNKFGQALSGASCWQLATNSGITLEQFFSWNPVVEPEGENCATQIWPDYYYCLGIGG